MKTLGDIRSENAAMSNEKSCEKVISFQWKAIYIQSIYASESVPKEPPRRAATSSPIGGLS